jgi:3-deoxy-D-arabino-heptulosonate 7-phosphate (DAHP) synthase
VFRGPRRTLTVETQGRRFTVECPATRAAAIGDVVTLSVEADNAWALSDNAQALRP